MSRERLARILFDELADESFYCCTHGNDLSDVYLDGYADLLRVANRVIESMNQWYLS